MSKGAARPADATQTPSPDPTALPDTPDVRAPESGNRADVASYAPVQQSPAEQVIFQRRRPQVVLATKALTVKVNVPVYKVIKNHGTNVGKSNQDIFTEALAMYMQVYGLKVESQDENA